VVGPEEYRKLVGWGLGALLLVAPILWGALLEEDKLRDRPEMAWATVAWFGVALSYLVYSQFTAGSEFTRWSRRYGDTVNEFGGGSSGSAGCSAIPDRLTGI